MAQPSDSPGADDQYHESSDEDFNPATAPVADETSSSSDDEPAHAVTKAKAASRKRKRKAPSPIEFDSGDEATIHATKSRRVRRRTGGKGDDEELFWSDDEGGEGGLVKTRAQRRVEQKERRPLANIDGATVDVDALWKQMSSAPLIPSSSAPAQDSGQKAGRGEEPGITGAPSTDDFASDSFITLRLVAKHAGKTDTFEKRVRKGSAAAKQYLSDGWKVVEAPPIAPDEPAAAKASSPDPQLAEPTTISDTQAIRRPLRRPFRFDPNPTAFVKGLPPDRQLTWHRHRTATGQENAMPPPAAKSFQAPEKVKKLNVVDKTRLDWTGFVDKEGLADDLDEYGKAKKNYRDQQEFLANVEAKEEEERRRAREKGKAKA